MHAHTGACAHTHTGARAHTLRHLQNQNQPVNPISSGVALRLPSKLDILVDRAGDHHSDNGVVPGAEEHERETQAHPQERQSPKQTEGDNETQAWFQQYSTSS